MWEEVAVFRRVVRPSYSDSRPCVGLYERPHRYKGWLVCAPAMCSRGANARNVAPCVVLAAEFTDPQSSPSLL